jgi:hypothetical protein
MNEEQFDLIAKSGFSVRHLHEVQTASGVRTVAELWYAPTKDVCAALYLEDGEEWQVRFLGGHNYGAQVAWAELLGLAKIPEGVAVDALNLFNAQLAEEA